jgi:hypothetical protein
MRDVLGQVQGVHQGMYPSPHLFYITSMDLVTDTSGVSTASLPIAIAGVVLVRVP